MDQKELARQMIQHNRILFESTFNSLVLLQDQMEKAMDVFLKKAAWFPDEGKKVTEEYAKSYKKAREAFKLSVDENFKKLEEFLDK
jgi:polyhydroxyalkanoate synthesis regulator phasin